MDLSYILSAAIYALMFFFMYICINPGGIGLVRLHHLSNDLHRAAGLLNDIDYCSDLEKEIRKGNSKVPGKLFSTKILTNQMQQYCTSIYGMQLKSSDKCQTDIDEFINYDLLHQQGRVDLCEHTANGFTALGLLGTFLGMAFGLSSLIKGNSEQTVADSSEQIINGIYGLIDGMDMAFVTSIFGIILSLALGTALRLILSKAESNLELFLTRFQNYVMCNQSEAALNTIIDHIVSIKSSLNTANELEVTKLKQTAAAFVKELKNAMEIDTGFLQTAIQDMSRQQQAHTKSIQKLNEQMNSMAQSLQSVGRSFLPILEQSSALSDQIESANQALKTSVKEIHVLLSEDTNALSKHQEVMAQLLRTSECLKKMTSAMQEQSVAVTEHYQSMANEHFNQVAQTSNQLIHQLVTHSTANMDTLQQHADALILDMHQSRSSASQMERLLQQNEIIIDQQMRLIRIMEKSVAGPRRPWTWRTKK